MTKLAHLALDGNYADARKLNAQLLPLMQINFIETNPLPVKAALAMMGLIEEVYRLPMVPMKRPRTARSWKKFSLRFNCSPRPPRSRCWVLGSSPAVHDLSLRRPLTTSA